jgi:hypothetical protein
MLPHRLDFRFLLTKFSRRRQDRITPTVGKPNSAMESWGLAETER